MRRAIARKSDGAALEAPVWDAIVRAYMAHGVDDAQMSALLMACVLRGTTLAEAAALTRAFVDSGEVMAAPDARAVDKHSSGGVGDSVSLIVVPLVAACGIPVAKLSGRALGHTGGTLDKLEAVAGVRTDLAPERFAAIVSDVGCAIAGQTERVVPADKRIYALRDRTSTVPALGLIAASMVSKKIAGGARGIVYDVKVGRGAFAADETSARELARTLVALTASFGRGSLALVTDMHEPLGRAIGTELEAIEARDFLRGRRDPRLHDVVMALGSAMLRIAGFADDARAALERALADGRAAARFEAMLSAQGMHPGALAALRYAEHGTAVRAPQDGHVVEIDPVALGELARELGRSGDHGAGVVLGARVGDAMRTGDVLATVYGGGAAGARAVRDAFVLAPQPPAPRPLVYVEIDSRAGGAALAVENGVAGPRSTPESK